MLSSWALSSSIHSATLSTWKTEIPNRPTSSNNCLIKFKFYSCQPTCTVLSETIHGNWYSPLHSLGSWFFGTKRVLCHLSDNSVISFIAHFLWFPLGVSVKWWGQYFKFGDDHFRPGPFPFMICHLKIRRYRQLRYWQRREISHKRINKQIHWQDAASLPDLLVEI